MTHPIADPFLYPISAPYRYTLSITQVKLFGSFVSGLSLPSSDLDMVIVLPKVHVEAAPEGDQGSRIHAHRLTQH